MSPDSAGSTVLSCGLYSLPSLTSFQKDLGHVNRMVTSKAWFCGQLTIFAWVLNLDVFCVFTKDATLPQMLFIESGRQTFIQNLQYFMEFMTNKVPRAFNLTVVIRLFSDYNISKINHNSHLVEPPGEGHHVGCKVVLFLLIPSTAGQFLKHILKCKNISVTNIITLVLYGFICVKRGRESYRNIKCVWYNQHLLLH